MGAVNLRMTAIAAMACALASLSLSAVVAGNGWLGAGLGAVVVVAAAGMLTRLASVPAAVGATSLIVIAVMPLLVAPTWVSRLGGLAIVVVTAAGAAGARLLRAVWILATYLASLLIYFSLLFAARPSYGWVIPSRGTIAALGKLTRQAFNEFQYLPPIPDHRGASLITAAGIGLAAVLVDIIAVRLRRPAVAGLPLLLLFCVPVASNLKSFGALQTLCFAAGLAGFLALLSADGKDRLRMWGPLVTFRYVQPDDETGAGPDTRDLAASGRRIGLAAICLAVIVPLVLPSMHSRHVFRTTSDGRGGGTLVIQDNPLADTQKSLQSKPSPVLTYTTTADDPHQQYLQQYVMTYEVKTDSWNILSPAGVLPPQRSKLPYEIPGKPGAAVTTPVTTTVQLGTRERGEAVLPAPYAPTGLSVRGSSWQEARDSLMIFSVSASPAGLRYTIKSQDADPTAAQISSQLPPGAISTEYGSYSGPDTTELQGIAARVTAGAATPLQRALALQAWFNSGFFTYTLKPHLPATHWLLPFLTTNRRGLCTQFAQAFAVLARLVGIPSRVAVGFTAGTFSRGAWHVTTADAHAWPELYFPGTGWLRFEPTPGGGNGQGTAYPPTYAGGGSGSARTGSGKSHSTAAPPGLPQAAGKASANNNFRKIGNPVGVAGHGATKTSGADFAIAIPVLLFLLLAWPALTRLVTRRRRWLAASSDAGLAHAAWRELTDDLTDCGLGGLPGETPRALARRVARDSSLDPAAEDALGRIAAAEERARYARSPQAGRGLAADVAVVRKAVAASVPRKQRLRARLLPASTLEAAGRLLQRAGDGLRWLEAPIPAIRRQRRTAVHRPG